jgi:hypothetical protein
MESLLELFGPSDHVYKSQLPPEPPLGNIEYKLKLVNPSKLRFQHLVTQVNHSKNQIENKYKDVFYQPLGFDSAAEVEVTGRRRGSDIRNRSRGFGASCRYATAAIQM